MVLPRFEQCCLINVTHFKNKWSFADKRKCKAAWISTCTGETSGRFHLCFRPSLQPCPEILNSRMAVE